MNETKATIIGAIEVLAKLLTSLKPHRIGDATVYRDRKGVLYCPVCVGTKKGTVPLQRSNAGSYVGADGPHLAKLYCPNCDYWDVDPDR